MRLLKRTAPHTLAFESFGVNVELTLGEAALVDTVQEILPPGHRPTRAPDRAGRFGLRQTAPDIYEVLVAGEPWLEYGSLDVALRLLDQQMRIYIATHATDWIFVHAGVVAGNRRALVVPGESFSGKSTLVRALVEAGGIYYSDEYAVFDFEGAIHPYPRRLSLRSADGVKSVEHDPHALGATVAEQPARLGAVVLTRYRATASWSPQRLSPGQGLVQLLANTIPAHERPSDALRVLRRAVQGVPVLSGDRGEADSIAAALLAELSG